MDVRGRRVLVTGATGFVGSHIVRALVEAGADTHVIARATSDRWRLCGLPDVRVHTADLGDAAEAASAVAEARPDALVHSAAGIGHPRTRGDRAAHVRDTVLATAHVVEAARASGVGRFVHISTSLVYAPRTDAVDESSPCLPATDRGSTKLAAEALCNALDDELVTLRLFSVYGPAEQPGRLVPTAIASSLLGRPMRVTAEPTKRDHVPAADVADACVRAITARLPDRAVINIASGTATSNHDLIRAVGEATGRPIALSEEPYPALVSDRPTWIGSPRRAEELLGWRARPLADGLRETVAWFERHLDRYAR